MSSAPPRRPIDVVNLRLGFEQAPLGTASIGLDGRYAQVNRAFCQMVGYAEAELIGTPFLQLTHPDIRARDTELFARMVAGDLAACRIAKRQIHKDGHAVDTTAHLGAVRDASGTVVFLVAQFQDVTDEKRETEALEQRAAMLETVRRVGEERAVLLREVNHRVKNNLQVISSLMNLQARQSVDLATRAALDDAQARVRSIAVIHEMLYQTPDLARVDMHEYVTRLARLLGHSFGALRAGHLTLEVHCESVVLPVDQAVPCGLILNELLTNAFKHAFRSPATEGARIEVSMAREGGELLLTVADNGVGLPDTIDPRETSTLGMSLLRMLAGQLRGTLDATGLGGTRIRVRFPVEL